MANDVTVIDFSSSGIRVVVGYFFEGKCYVLDAMEGEAIPLDIHGFLEKKKSEESLHYLLSAVSNKLKRDPGLVIPLYPADGFTVKSANGISTTVDPTGQITQVDFTNCSNMIEKEVRQEGKRFLFDEPTLFLDDSKNRYFDFPLGKISDSLDVMANGILIDDESYKHYRQILLDLNLDIYFELAAPQAATLLFNLFGAPKEYLGVDLEKDYTYFSYVTKGHIKSAKRSSYGMDNLVASSSEELGLSSERTRELLNLFGLRSKSGFSYMTPDKKTLEDTSSAFRSAFLPLIQEAEDFLAETSSTKGVQAIFYGPGSDIENLASTLESGLRIPVSTFLPKVIGARSKVFLNALGAIRASDFPYLPSYSEVEKRKGHQGLENTTFQRVPSKR